jgi:outer membrane protein
MRTVSGKTLVILILGTLIGAGAGAQGNKMTLDDCIELALQKRASIIAARGAESLAKANQRSALGAFLPRIDASYNYSRGKETDIEPPDPVDEQDLGTSKSLSVTAGMSVFNLSNWFNYFSSRSARNAARLDVLNSEQDLIYSVKLSYYAYLAAVRWVEVQQSALARSEEQLKLIQSRFDLGSASLSDVLKQKVLSGNDQLALLRAKNSVVTSKATLAYTIGMDPSTDIEFSADYTVREIQGTVDEAISFGLLHEPGLLAARSNVSAASRGVKASYARYLPSVSASYSFTKFNGTQAFPAVFDYSSVTRRWGFGVSWNIFDGFGREGYVTSNKVYLNNARASLADIRNIVTRDIKTAYFEIEQQREASRVAAETVDASTEDLKITQEKYNLGAATILDLLNAQASLIEAQVAQIQADFDLNLAIAQLENAMGKM